jgi:serine/threonine protein kinase
MRRTTRTLESGSASDGKRGNLQAGVTLQDRYLVLGIIGSGGMSSVYKGRDLHFPNVTKLVAIKEMINTAADPTMREMILRNFEREADLLATLYHPSIPRIYDYFNHDESSFLVMEFIDGKDLEELLRETDSFMPEDQIISWAVELCDVLSYLHNHRPQPVIFRDMKPSNIMIDNHGHVRLIDFGIARIFQPGEKGTMIGTEGYSPPEQYRGEASPVGDIYALGATLHHLLSNRDPRAEAPFSFAERPIHEVNPNISPELEAVINVTLAYDPSDRYPSVEAFKQALLATAKQTGVLQTVMARTALHKSNQIEELWSFECEDEVRGSPIVYKGMLLVGCYDNNLYSLDAKTGKYLWKYATEGGIPSRPAAQDDMIFICSEDYRAYALTADQGQPLWSYYTEAPIRSSPVIYEGHLFFGSDDSHLHVVNMQTGQRAWRANATAPIRSTPLIANERVYFGCENGDFYCVDFRGENKWRFRAKRAITSSPILVDGILYFGAMDWTLYAVEADEGWQVWRFRMGRQSISTPVYSEGKIFTGCADGHIYAIDAKTSREIWRFHTEHQVTASPIIHEDSLYCGSVDGAMYCLDMRTGRLRWKFATDGPITGTAVIHNNILYFGSNDHKLYALLI